MTLFDRDLSWLEFNYRVLYQALDDRTPLLERVRFLSIFSSNLDEFFMKRVGRLRQKALFHDFEIPGQIATESLLHQVRGRVTELIQLRSECYTQKIIPKLKDEGIELVAFSELTDAEKEYAHYFFKTKVFPVLTPLAVDPAHPFPFLSNLSVSLGMQLYHPGTKQKSFARIKIPDILPQWIQLNRSAHNFPVRFLRLGELIQENLKVFFEEYEIKNTILFRVTRNADIVPEEEEIEDVMDLVEEELRQRQIAEIVRLEYAHAHQEPLRFLKEELELEDADCYQTDGELNFKSLDQIANLHIQHLKFRSWVPTVRPEFTNEGPALFSAMAKKDILIHHPYESFSASVERFLESAVSDTHVLAIKMTLYRTGKESPIIPLLIKAAASGKQVVCVVELKARFDEANNLQWGAMLEKAGVHVVYGVVGLKTHAKLLLVVRQEQDDYRFYAHLGTGNYNSDTAKLYTDFSFFTCRTEITSEVINVFNYLTGLSSKKNYEYLLVAPVNMSDRFLNLIHEEIAHHEAGRPTHIVAKMNSLEDPTLCEALYKASQKGVPIDLIVRGFCCVRPGVSGLSENINVISVLGRFLEHSRVFYFRAGQENVLGGRFFISSADWMPRNLKNRVEVATPILGRENKKKCWNVLKYILTDTHQTWISDSSGKYYLKTGAKKMSLGVQEQLIFKTQKMYEA